MPAPAALAAPIDPNQVVQYNGQPMAIKDVPSVTARAMLGYGHTVQEIRDRKIHPGYPMRPLECTHAALPKGEWINDGKALVCTGCGMDYT